MPTAFERMSDQRDEARNLSRALYCALTEVADDYQQIHRADQRLDPDFCLPYWLTEAAGAPDTWQPDAAPDDDEDEG